MSGRRGTGHVFYHVTCCNISQYVTESRGRDRALVEAREDCHEPKKSSEQSRAAAAAGGG